MRRLGYLLWAVCFPAFSMEFDEFIWGDEGIKAPVTMYWNQHLLRIETPDRQFAIIMNTATADYTGIELRDARYWTFSWTKLQETLDKRRANAALLHTSLALESNPPEPPKTPTYAWKKTSSLKTITNLPCQLWETKDENDRRIALWCTMEPNAPPRDLWKNFALTESRLNLVAVRTVGPNLPPEALDSLPSEAGTPVEVILGEEEDADSLILKSRHQIPDDNQRFLPPPKYQQDPLSALEGLQ